MKNKKMIYNNIIYINSKNIRILQICLGRTQKRAELWRDTVRSESRVLAGRNEWEEQRRGDDRR